MPGIWLARASVNRVTAYLKLLVRGRSCTEERLCRARQTSEPFNNSVQRLSQERFQSQTQFPCSVMPGQPGVLPKGKRRFQTSLYTDPERYPLLQDEAVRQGSTAWQGIICICHFPQCVPNCESCGQIELTSTTCYYQIWLCI